MNKHLQPDQFALEVSDGRDGAAFPAASLLISEPFYAGDEDRVYAALDALHLRGRLHYPDGSDRAYLPELAARVCDRIYPPASGGRPLDPAPTEKRR
jgi:hypothetical protein